jgi:hypothetical protein
MGQILHGSARTTAAVRLRLHALHLPLTIEEYKAAFLFSGKHPFLPYLSSLPIP